MLPFLHLTTCRACALCLLAPGESSGQYRQISSDICYREEQSRAEVQAAGQEAVVIFSMVVRAGLMGKILLEPGLEEVSSVGNEGECFGERP